MQPQNPTAKFCVRICVDENGQCAVDVVPLDNPPADFAMSIGEALSRALALIKDRGNANAADAQFDAGYSEEETS